MSNALVVSVIPQNHFVTAEALAADTDDSGPGHDLKLPAPSDLSTTSWR